MGGITRQKEITLDANERSSPFLIADLEDVTIQFIGISDAQVDIEVTNEDGMDEAIPSGSWVSEGSTVTADGMVSITEGPRWLSLNKTAGTDSPRALITGRLT